VHLGEKSLPVAEAKRLVWTAAREQFVIGVSCHSLEAAGNRRARRRGLSFFWPRFRHAIEGGVRAPQGLERLATVVRAVSIPVLAIGGITLEKASACLAAGASGIAAIRLFRMPRTFPLLHSRLRSLAGY